MIREFLPKADLLPYCEAIVRVYNLLGRRDNKYKARIKITVAEKELDPLKKKVEQRQREYNSVEREKQSLLREKEILGEPAGTGSGLELDAEGRLTGEPLPEPPPPTKSAPVQESQPAPPPPR